MIGLEGWIERFCEWMALQNYSARTVESYRANLGLFSDGLGQRPDSPGSLAELDHELLSDYQQHLFTRKSYDDRKKRRMLSASYRNMHLVALRSFFRFLVLENILLVDPSQRLQWARFEQRLPVVLSEKEMARLLGAIDITEPLGLRDRAVVELAYSTGMRRSEPMGLHLSHLDLVEELVRVLGKGGRERVLPVGAEAARALRSWLEVRSELVSDPGVLHVFVNCRGLPLVGGSLGLKLKRYARAAAIKKRVCFHTFRHSCATHLLKRGADVRYIQALLGHYGAAPGAPADAPSVPSPGVRKRRRPPGTTIGCSENCCPRSSWSSWSSSSNKPAHFGLQYWIECYSTFLFKLRGHFLAGMESSFLNRSRSEFTETGDQHPGIIPWSLVPVRGDGSGESKVLHLAAHRFRCAVLPEPPVPLERTRMGDSPGASNDYAAAAHPGVPQRQAIRPRICSAVRFSQGRVRLWTARPMV